MTSSSASDVISCLQHSPILIESRSESKEPPKIESTDAGARRINEEKSRTTMRVKFQSHQQQQQQDQEDHDDATCSNEEDETANCSDAVRKFLITSKPHKSAPSQTPSRRMSVSQTNFHQFHIS